MTPDVRCKQDTQQISICVHNIIKLMVLWKKIVVVNV